MILEDLLRRALESGNDVCETFDERLNFGILTGRAVLNYHIKLSTA